MEVIIVPIENKSLKWYILSNHKLTKFNHQGLHVIAQKH